MMYLIQIFDQLQANSLIKVFTDIKYRSLLTIPEVQLEKFFIQEFLDSYPSAISNQQKTKIKKTFLQLIQVLKQHDLVESHYQIISNGRFLHTQQLTTDNISEGFVLYEKISI